MAEKPTYEELKQRVKALERVKFEHKRTEEALRESEEKFRTVADFTYDWEFWVDPAGNHIYVSPSCERITGYRANEFILNPNLLKSIVHPDDRGKVIAHNHIAIETGEILPLDFRIITRSGDERWIGHFCQSVYSDDGRYLGQRGSNRDVTDRKQAKETLLREEEKFRVLVEKSPLGVSLIREDGHYEYVNPKFIEMFGYTLKDIPSGGDWFIKAYPDSIYRREVISTWIDDLEKHKTGESRPRSFKVSCKGGSEKDVYFRAVAMETGEQVVIYEDFTERIRSEAQLQQVRKMEAIGTLAGGIAHQFNNALSVITGNLDLFEEDFPGDKSIMNYANRMKESTRRMAQLTAQLLAYSRGGKYQAKTVSLSDFVKETLRLVQHRIDSAIHVDTDLPRDISNVKADTTQMQMVLSNILTNASEAIEGKGSIRVSIQEVAITNDTAKDFPGLTPGNYTCLTVTDDGKGMDEETRKRIFEPFFTTRFYGRGLGMAAAYGIVKNHDGGISVDSELGRGTIVKIYLPALRADRLGQ